jgi:hypothetical protein
MSTKGSLEAEPGRELELHVGGDMLVLTPGFKMFMNLGQQQDGLEVQGAQISFLGLLGGDGFLHVILLGPEKAGC